jgi:uncharacterized protein (DUF2147 family)
MNLWGLNMAMFAKSAIAFVMLLAVSTFAWSGDLAGLWQAYDDHTGNLEALIRIEKMPDNSYEGRIEKLYPSAGETASVCSNCKGSLHNQPLLGLRILYGMKHRDQLNFEGGEILDPDEGTTYRCQIQLSEDGKTIQVTGYINFNWIGQSEIWRRAN